MLNLNEDTKEQLQMWECLVNMNEKEILNFYFENKKKIDENIIDDTENIIRMKKKSPETWNKIEWCRCKRYNGIIGDIISSKEKLTEKEIFILNSYGHNYK